MAPSSGEAAGAVPAVGRALHTPGAGPSAGATQRTRRGLQAVRPPPSHHPGPKAKTAKNKAWRPVMLRMFAIIAVPGPNPLSAKEETGKAVIPTVRTKMVTSTISLVL